MSAGWVGTRVPLEELDLGEAELFIVAATARGDIAALDVSLPREARSVRASVIRQLLLRLPLGDGFGEPFPVRLPGVRVRNAVIVGELDLKDCAGPGGNDGLPALELSHCEIEQAIEMSHARLARLSVEGSTFRLIHAHGLRLDGPFDISNSGFPKGSTTAEASIDLTGAIIDGEVIGQGARLRCIKRDGPVDPSETHYALRLSDAAISGSVSLNRGFIADGGVTISATQIDGEMWVSRASFIAGEGVALNARGAIIQGQVMMIDGFRAEGRVTFRGARIAGDLSLDRERNSGRADAGLRDESVIIGELDIRGAVIDGSVEFGGSRLENPGQWAVNAAGMRVGKDVTIRAHKATTHVSGGLRFEGAVIEGEVYWQNLCFEQAWFNPDPDAREGTLITLADAQIARSLKPRSLSIAGELQSRRLKIDLTGAHCAALDDDLEHGWGPAHIHLGLDGFVYDRLERDQQSGRGNNSSDRWDRRKKWLRERFEQHEGFHPQPYAHLARVYAEAGWYDDMRRVQRRRHTLHLQQEESRAWMKPLGFLYWLVAGFGYAPHRAVVSLLLFLLIGTAGVAIANCRHALVYDLTAIAVQEVTLLEDGDWCGEQISAPLYALDVAIPLIDLRQESQCEPGAAPDSKLFPGVRVTLQDYTLVLFEEVTVWRWAKAIYAILGAILTAIAVLTFTGALRTVKDD